MSTQSNLFIGVMSGTSVDAIDIALIEIIDNQTKFIAGEEYAFDQKLRQRILDLCDTQKSSLKALGEMTTELSQAYADAIATFITSRKLSASDIRAIGCHGQTVFHAPNSKQPFSMQLVNANIIAAKNKITTVTDFRNMDIALGGQGAPLVPLFHQSLLPQLCELEHVCDVDNVVFLNIGGIANISVVSSNSVYGFDTGPGNVLIDMWAGECLNRPYDKDGQFAREGQVNDELLNHFLNDQYFRQPAPKSTGREYFNRKWLEAKFAMFPKQLSDQDIMATLTALTYQSVANELAKLQTGKLIICGAGARNPNFTAGLKNELSKWQVRVAEQTSLSSDFIEAMAFAWLAYRCITKQAGNSPNVTGASHEEICGQITQVMGHHFNG